ncbi:MAG: FAD-binding oxidoreductase [Muribaculaceae bacterium]|nr:FAD-binding oxidoreductase [Muribaculaceae bacterium]
MPDNSRIQDFLADVGALRPAPVMFTDRLRRLAWGTDAGFYRLLPQAVLSPATEEQVSEIMRLASRHGVAVTFRAAGTSLSGQAVTDSVLLVAGKSWEGYTIGPDAATITLQPGIIGERVNEILRPYGRKFDPDPASKRSAMVGGIVANNASGMNCGTHANSDSIMRSARIVLADGTVLDTADAASRASFGATHAAMLAEIESIRDDIRADEELTARIRYKYSIKNVTGLNLRPFVEFDDPFDIMAHCMVGSEGTLAFLSSVTMATSAILPCAASAMLYFGSMREAAEAVVAMRKDAPIDSCELLDAKSLASVGTEGVSDGLTALLLDTKAATPEALQANIDAIMAVVAPFRLVREAHFSTDPAETGAWWSMRSGVFPAVGGTRPVGTTVLIEDVAFHIDDLPDATVALVELIRDCGYDDACIYGHAMEGNFHFVISQSFDTPEEVERYRRLMLGVKELVVDRFDGSLKAEHGTGRNMAPFVEKEWGTKAYTMMKRLKATFDPQGILNPGVVFNDDPECFIHNIKPLPRVDAAVDRCIECGFCEVNCVSCGLTLSARQRIVVAREMARLRAEATLGALREADALDRAFRYYGVDTCAGDGLCSTSCPMRINTADLVHRFRERRLPPGSAGYRAGDWAARHLAGISTGLRATLATARVAADVLGPSATAAVGRALHSVGVPLWTPALPGPSHPGRAVAAAPHTGQRRRVVYFPSCLNRAMGATPEHGRKLPELIEVVVQLCGRAGFEVIFPEGMDRLCCGMIWESKGMPEVADAKTAELEAALLKASEGGRYPVLCDQSPCLHRMREHIKGMHLYEPAEFIHDVLSPYLEFHPVDRSVAVHVTCSTRRMGLADKIIALARKCCRRVTVPAEVGCCGFAGDKGFTHPELNAWGLRKLRPAIAAAGATEGYSNSRTCEIGLTDNSGVPYKSIAYLVLECTTPKLPSHD